jgi:hypothetical protein
VPKLARGGVIDKPLAASRELDFLPSLFLFSTDRMEV